MPWFHSVPCAWHSHAFLLLQPLPTTRGEGCGTSTYPRNPIQEEGNYYIKGVEGDRKRELRTPNAPKAPEKSSSDRAKDQSSLVNSVHLSLIVKNIVLTAVHTLKPSSLAYSLQIHCTELTGLRSHASWAWAEKLDPTLSYPFFFYFIFSNTQFLFSYEPIKFLT